MRPGVESARCRSIDNCKSPGCAYESAHITTGSCPTSSGFGLYSARRCYFQLPVVDACSAFCSLGWVVMVYLLLLAVLLVLVMLTGLRGFAHIAAVVLLGMRCILCLSVLPLLLYDSDMLASSLSALTPCVPFSLSKIIWEFSTT